MPKYRQLHTKVVDSYDLAGMPDDFTRLFYLLLIVVLDSQGRAIDNPAWLRSKAFPLREDVTIEQINGAMDYYDKKQLIVRYEAEGNRFFYCPSFLELQSGLNNETPSTLPEPTPVLLPSNPEPTPELPESYPPPMQCNAMQDNTRQGKVGTKPARPSLQFFNTGWHVRVFTDATMLPGIPQGDMPKVMNALEDLRPKFNTETEMSDYLKRYFEFWKTKKTKDGRAFSRSNCAWLYDWAVAGDPLPGDKQPSRKPDPNCPKCNGVGMVSGGKKFGEDGFGKAVPCDCLKEVVNV